MKFRKTNKVGKFEVKKVKNKGAVSKMSFLSRSVHAPLKLQFVSCSNLVIYEVLVLMLSPFSLFFRTLSS